jgi:phosphoribosylformylglycinamidine synthase I
LKVAVLIFPGSNCDHDALHVSQRLMGWDATPVWHQDTELPANTDLVIVPGGFSYGDYLRCGAIASLAPIMKAVHRHADEGRWVLGICNGFQILCEAGLLPGALLRNRGLQFLHQRVHLRVERNDLPFTASLSHGQLLEMPIAHGEGNYTCDEETLALLHANRQIVFKYAHPSGEVNDTSAANGSLEQIAGIVNPSGNVLGLMPHPERACEASLGMMDGLGIFQSLEHSSRLVS